MTVVFCDHNMPLSLKKFFYRIAVRPTLLYGTECWINKKQYIQKVSVVEMQMLRWMYGKIMKNKVKNENIRRQVGIAPIKDKLRENRLRWSGDIGCKLRDAFVRRMKKSWHCTR